MSLMSSWKVQFGMLSYVLFGKPTPVRFQTVHKQTNPVLPFTPSPLLTPTPHYNTTVLDTVSNMRLYKNSSRLYYQYRFVLDSDHSNYGGRQGIRAFSKFPPGKYRRRFAIKTWVKVGSFLLQHIGLSERNWNLNS